MRHATHTPEQLVELTTREREVLRLVGRGLSNLDIAGRLIISEATVKTHLNRAVSKLGLAGRAQAVVLAYETGLVTPSLLWWGPVLGLYTVVVLRPGRWAVAGSVVAAAVVGFSGVKAPALPAPAHGAARRCGRGGRRPVRHPRAGAGEDR